MAEELQGILDRINADGIAKADAERKEIIAKAKDEAAKIIADEALWAIVTTLPARSDVAKVCASVGAVKWSVV